MKIIADTPEKPAASVTITCHCKARHVVDVGSHRDPRGELVELARGWGGRSRDTLRAWVRSGRLKAYTVERSALVAWESDLRAAIEAAPAWQRPSLDAGDGVPRGLKKEAT